MAAPSVPEPEGKQPRHTRPVIPAQVPRVFDQEASLSDDVLKELYSRAFRYLRSRGVNEADAGEIAQESVLAAWKKRPPLGRKQATALAVTVAHNKWVDLIRAKTRRPESLTDFNDWDRPSGEDVELLAENSEQAREAVKILKEVVPSKRERDAFVMCELWCLTSKEAAFLLGAPSAGAVRTALSQAREKLKVHRGAQSAG